MAPAVNKLELEPRREEHSEETGSATAVADHPHPHHHAHQPGRRIAAEKRIRRGRYAHGGPHGRCVVCIARLNYETMYLNKWRQYNMASAEQNSETILMTVGSEVT
jgi:hypothetical protein